VWKLIPSEARQESDRRKSDRRYSDRRRKSDRRKYLKLKPWLAEGLTALAIRTDG
jgi:hypothetical protein